MGSRILNYFGKAVDGDIAVFDGLTRKWRVQQPADSEGGGSGLTASVGAAVNVFWWDCDPLLGDNDNWLTPSFNFPDAPFDPAPAGGFGSGAEVYQDAPADGDVFTIDVLLLDGTWTATVFYTETEAGGKAQLASDAVNVGALIDTYGADGSPATPGSAAIAGITGGALRRITLTLTGKNASSSDYYLGFRGIRFVKTA